MTQNMEVCRCKVIYYCLILISVSSISCQIFQSKSQFIYFDEATGLTSHNTNITCPSNTVILISSIRYYYKSYGPCTQLTCPTSSGFLNGTNDVCQNENKIRAECYARDRCSLTAAGVTRPNEECDEGYRKANRISMSFACLRSDYVFDLCEDRYMQVNTDTPIILTTPSVSTASNKISCSCQLTPSDSTQQFLSENLTLIRQKMAQFRDNERFIYSYGRQKNIFDAHPYNDYYLLNDETHLIGEQKFAAKKFTVIISRSDSGSITGASKAYILFEPGKGNTVRCNKAIGNPEAYMTTLSGLTTVSAVSAMSTGSTMINSTRGGKNLTNDGNLSSKGGGDESIDMKTIVALVIVIIVILIAAVLIITILCVRRKRERQTQKYQTSLSMNDNVELSPLNPPHGAILENEHHEPVPENEYHEPALEDEYHELEEFENQYAVIPGENPYSDPHSQAEQVVDADPYKVTVLEGDTLPTHYYDRQISVAANECSSPSDLVRNSRGSIDTYTENSTITDDYYSQPCDVKGDNSTDPPQVEYDVPAGVNYSVVHKPKLELFDNPLYEPSCHLGISSLTHS